MIRRLKDLEQEAMDELDPENYEKSKNEPRSSQGI